MSETREEIRIITPPEPNTRIRMSDSASIIIHRNKPFNRFQRWMINFCFGWKTEVIE